MKKTLPASRQGFSLAEILIVVTILAVTAILVLMNFKKQSTRGYDSKRKTDLAALKIVFEDYYNDKNCYPTKEQWDAYDCITKANNDFLKSYLGGKDIPCDPQTNTRYLYMTINDKTGGACGGYRAFSQLGDAGDGSIKDVGCDPDPNKGCGYAPYSFNYGIAIGGNVANPEFDFNAPTPTQTPPPAPTPGQWVCTQNEHNCQGKSQPCQLELINKGCTTYEDSSVCNELCNPRKLNLCTFANDCL